MSRSVFISSVVITLSLASCSSTTRHGDARLFSGNSPSFLPAAMAELILPEVPIGRTSVIRYRILSLPHTIYPSGFELEVPENEAPVLPGDTQFPWSNCVIRASLTNPDGSVFFSRTINLGRDRRGSGPGRRNHRKIFFPFTDYQMDGTTSLPRHRSYELQIEVLRPSFRASDKLTVDALSNPSRYRTLR